MLSILLNKPIKNNEEHILRYYNDSVFPYVTGLEVKAHEVYSVCPGKVISVGYTVDSLYSVTVLVNRKQAVRYTNLLITNVEIGDEIKFRTRVGVADKFVRFEYCTSTHVSKWPVRIKSLTFYKNDPVGLLKGDVKLEITVHDVKQARGDEPMIPLDKHV